MNQPTIRPPWWREAVKTVNTGESMTQESHAEAADINAIVARFDRTGQLPLATRQPYYADVTHLQQDLTELYNQSRDVLQRFEEFSSDWQPQAPETPTAPPAPSPPPATPPETLPAS